MKGTIDRKRIYRTLLVLSLGFAAVATAGSPSAGLVTTGASGVVPLPAGYVPPPAEAVAVAATDETPGIQGPPRLRFPLVMCPDLPGPGNLYPWANDSFFFASSRTQYLYPSSVLQQLANRGVLTIESIHSRIVSFGTTMVAQYAAPSRVRVVATSQTILSKTFADNYVNPIDYLDRSGNFTISTFPYLQHAYSRCTGPACPRGDDLDVPIDLSAPPYPNLLVDIMTIVATSGNSGLGVWSVSDCPNQRAVGSGAFANSSHLTTALEVDNYAFQLVFKGLICTPAPCFNTQVQQTIRLLSMPPDGEVTATP